MGLSREEFDRLAVLSRLRFSEEERADFEKEFDEIIEFADTINSSVAGDASSIRDVLGEEREMEELRDDTVETSLTPDLILSNVEGERGYFKVRQVKL